MKIESIGRNEAKQIGAVLRELEPRLAEIGLTMKLGTLRFDCRSVRTTVTLEVAAGKAEHDAQKDAQDWRFFARLYDLPEDGIGRTFVAGAKTFRVVRLNSRGKKRPVIAADVKTGSLFCFSAEAVRIYLTQKASA